MSDTPRTDSVLAGDYMAMMELARQLERELRERTHELARLEYEMTDAAPQATAAGPEEITRGDKPAVAAPTDIVERP